jgi:hypothetical protein
VDGALDKSKTQQSYEISSTMSKSPSPTAGLAEEADDNSHLLLIVGIVAVVMLVLIIILLVVIIVLIYTKPKKKKMTTVVKVDDDREEDFNRQPSSRSYSSVHQLLSNKAQKSSMYEEPPNNSQTYHEYTSVKDFQQQGGTDQLNHIYDGINYDAINIKQNYHSQPSKSSQGQFNVNSIYDEYDDIVVTKLSHHSHNTNGSDSIRVGVVTSQQLDEPTPIPYEGEYRYNPTYMIAPPGLLAAK